jgi:hypothetical protein
MRRFFLFAVLWAALFGPGHVLAACPMGAPAEQGSHAPCHSDEDRNTTTTQHGHDCCAWLTSSGVSGKFFTQKSGEAFGDLSPDAFAPAMSVSWVAPAVIRPPPIPISRHALRSAAGSGDTFLRTGRLRL